ncbi:aminoglycoside phosphotransferase family protein [Pseudooceanicola aestuarii]|uniref:aminoglycoside phosphotransferase family protein n=1 Tax=Pseudooceanicola aestuarii TaxID=2697319 RepID=UPI0013D765B8|nr:aminoglycoside phosphotransferase family protein [Pseudooceanicola aestuarii]
MVKLPDAVDENMSFLLAELDGQLARLIGFFEDPGAPRAEALISRAGYSHNLSVRVRKACLAATLRGKRGQAQDQHLQGVDTIARNLDLISRLARRAVGHAMQIARPRLMRADTYVAPLREVRKTLAGVQAALRSRDSAQAAEIGRRRAVLDSFHDRLFRTYTRDMASSKQTEDLAHALLALNEINRLGEALEAISAALLSINIGQTVKFERYFTLRSVLDGLAGDDEKITLQPLAETRSGSAISSVSTRDSKGRSVAAVFKDGDRRKLKEERVGVKSWNSVYPGLVPEILSYEKHGKSAALLIEHLDGHTFEDIVLGGSDAELARAQAALHRTVRDIWRQTRTEDPAAMGAMDQLARRMQDSYRLHPRFNRGTQRINGLTVDSLETLIAAAAQREATMIAPFSVYIHGDFNLDNVIYDPAAGKIRFIDLHRSRYMDYVQDVSVFMVSNYRLQVVDAATRVRIAGVVTDMHQVAAKFARRQKDPGFEYRLALGLARSFASSTRFVLDRDHAGRMMLRARYILEKALAVPPGKEARFKLPIRMLFSD